MPIIGAWTAGILVFALTLADEGTTSAIVMGLIIFAANGPLQQVVQPIVFGATLRLNPLVVFSVTIAAGTLFGHGRPDPRRAAGLGGRPRTRSPR